MSLLESVPEDRLPRLAMADAVAWSVLASLLLHAALVGAALWWPRRPAAPPPEEPSFAVDFVTSDEYATETAPPPSAVAAPSMAAPAPSAPVAGPAAGQGTGVAAPGMIHPTRMLSALALAEPGSAEAAKELAHFNGEERAVQLCNLEAIEQLRAWKPTFRPERIIAYATADEATAGDTIKAPGAAFLSGGAWYELAYECVLAPGRATVDGFQFRVGAAIPRDAWDDDHLPTAK